jgi:hypothetical protein
MKTREWNGGYHQWKWKGGTEKGRLMDIKS